MVLLTTVVLVPWLPLAAVATATGYAALLATGLTKVQRSTVVVVCEGMTILFLLGGLGYLHLGDAVDLRNQTPPSTTSGQSFQLVMPSDTFSPGPQSSNQSSGGATLHGL